MDIVWPDVIVPRLQGVKVAQPPAGGTKVKPAGVGSLSETPLASDGPLLVTLMLYVIVFPAVVVAGPDLVTDKSAFCTTAPPADAELLAAFESGVDELTVAVLVTDPLALEGTEN